MHNEPFMDRWCLLQTWWDVARPCWKGVGTFSDHIGLQNTPGTGIFTPANVWLVRFIANGGKSLATALIQGRALGIFKRWPNYMS